MKVFITGIGTDVGKSVASAILTTSFQTDYWKPIQTGDKDTDWVKSLLPDSAVVHPATYTFKIPASPHYAAAQENIIVNAHNFILPDTKNHLIVEGAGGVMVPLNEQFMVIDLMQQLKLPVIVVSRHYLGSINHKLLTIEALRNRNLNILGVIFNGNKNAATEKAITSLGNVTTLGRIDDENEINAEVIKKYSLVFKENHKLASLFQS